MNTRELSRRRFLRGALGGSAVAIGLPRLAPMLDANGLCYAATGDRPIRYVTWGFANGVVPDLWNPANTGSGSSWKLSSALQPLAAWKSHLSVVGNVKAHGTSQHGCGNTFFVTGAEAPSREPKAASIDQVIAAAVGKNTPLKSLEVGIVNAPEDEEPGRMTWSHNGPKSYNFPSYDVGEVFDRLFGPNGAAGGIGASTPSKPSSPFSPSSPSGAALRRARQSVLDFVLEDSRRLRSALPASDRQRLDQHLEGVFALEKRIAMAEADEDGAGDGSGSGSVGGGCQRPDAPGGMIGGGKLDQANANVNAAMAQLLALAFACDLTRAATVVVTQAGSKAQMPDAGITDWHGLSHEPEEEDKIQRFVVRQIEYLAALAKAFHDTPDGDGTLLDNAAIMTVNDCTDGWNHSGDDMPVAILGKAGGRLRGDVHFRGASDYASAVCLTVGRAVAGLERFGSGTYERSEPINDLLA